MGAKASPVADSTLADDVFPRDVFPLDPDRTIEKDAVLEWS
ncbi:hypothetical protein [Lentzea aerocolonigenes]|nr:hypothetical protein [Lentzea aerocolonigenes]